MISKHVCYDFSTVAINAMKSGVLSHLDDVFHVFHVFHVLQICVFPSGIAQFLEPCYKIIDIVENIGQ